MKRNLGNCLFAVLAALPLLFFSVPTRAGEGNVNEKNVTITNDKSGTNKDTASTNNANVASVNGIAIAQAQLDIAMAPYELQIAAMGEGAVSDEDIADLKNNLLENLIGYELLYQESQKIGIKVLDKEVNDTYDSQKAQFNTEAEFLAALKEAKYNEKTFKDKIRLSLSVQQFIDKKFTQNTTISDEEIKKYYDDNPSYFQQPEQVRASHIMIMVASDADQAKKDEAKKQIEQILKRSKAGEDFAALAKEASQDPTSKDNGGDLGYFSKGDMVQNFEDAAFALKTGETSGIVETEYGYHIIKCTDKTAAKTITLDESKEEIRSSLKNNKINSDVSKYVAELRSKAKVEIFLAK